jgi:hypothetical protein
VLASLLPGVRDLRAPLAAGYIWLLVGWLLVHERYAGWDKDGGPLGALIDLADALTPVGLGIAASFVAYLIGSLSQSLTEPLWNHLPRLGRDDAGLRASFAKVISAWLKKWEAAFQREGGGRGRVGEALKTELPSVNRDELAATVVSEAEVIADNLLDEGSELYGTVDRLRGEVELRLAIGLPLTVLLLVLAFQSSPLWLLGIVGVLGLTYDAGVKQRERMKRIRAALTSKPSRSPTLSRIEGALNVLLEQDRRARETSAKEEADRAWFEGQRQAGDPARPPA